MELRLSNARGRVVESRVLKMLYSTSEQRKPSNSRKRRIAKPSRSPAGTAPKASVGVTLLATPPNKKDAYDSRLVTSASPHVSATISRALPQPPNETAGKGGACGLIIQTNPLLPRNSLLTSIP